MNRAEIELALAKVESGIFALLDMDAMMPKNTGYDYAADVREVLHKLIEARNTLEGQLFDEAVRAATTPVTPIRGIDEVTRG